jgi:uncharacterized membrane protein YfcA
MMIVTAIVFVATLVRSTFGFGEALVAVPLLALIMPLDSAAPLAVLLSITVAAAALAQDWRMVQWPGATRLVLATLVGSPLGLLLLTRAPERIVVGLLGLVILAFSAFSLTARVSLHLKDDRLAWAFGFAAGILGGAYGMNGPPLVVYGTLRRWPPQHFRATLQGYFLPASVVVMFGYWTAGLWTSSLTRQFLLVLPAAVAAIALGRVLNRRLSPHAFIRYVHAALAAIGIALLFRALNTR